jgi:hypothetical protein
VVNKRWRQWCRPQRRMHCPPCRRSDRVCALWGWVRGRTHGCRCVESTQRSWTAVATCFAYWLQRGEHSIVDHLLQLDLATLPALVDDVRPDGVLHPLHVPACRNRGRDDNSDRDPLDSVFGFRFICSNISHSARYDKKKVHARPAASLEAKAYPK